MFGWLKPKRQGAESVPPHLVAAIEAAVVTFRDHGDPESGPRLLVKVSGLGCWFWTGTAEAAERFQRMHDLPPATARKAARLLAATVAAKNRGEYRQPGRRRSGWVGSVLEW